MPAGDRAVVQALVPGAWYDVQLYVRLVRAVCDNGEVDGSWTAQQVGRFAADRDFTSVHRWFLRWMRPSFAMENMNLHWRRTQDTGAWVSDIDDRGIVARLSGWDAVDSLVCHRLVGYFGRALELMCCTKVKITHLGCRAHGAPECTFRAACDLPSDRVCAGRVCPDVDLVDVVRELGPIDERELVAEAIGELVRTQLGLQPPAPEPDASQRLASAAGRWGLTARETAVLGQGIIGKTNKEIASELECAEVTVELHMSRIFRKSGASNRATLVAQFWSERL